jgi:hypothetical protein
LVPRELLASKSGRWDSNPRLSAWEADVLPLNYSRKKRINFNLKINCCKGGAVTF